MRGKVESKRQIKSVKEEEGKRGSVKMVIHG